MRTFFSRIEKLYSLPVGTECTAFDLLRKILVMKCAHVCRLKGKIYNIAVFSPITVTVHPAMSLLIKEQINLSCMVHILTLKKRYEFY